MFVPIHGLLCHSTVLHGRAKTNVIWRRRGNFALYFSSHDLVHQHQCIQGIISVFVVLILVIGGVVAAAVVLLKRKVRNECFWSLLARTQFLHVVICSQDQETRRYVDSVVSSYLPMEDGNDDEEEEGTHSFPYSLHPD